MFDAEIPLHSPASTTGNIVSLCYWLESCIADLSPSP
jgi:hypothetical protein